MSESYDAVVIGSGPNGLAAAIRLLDAGRSVLLLEADETFGGGLRSAELTLPGFVHDVCSAVHPTGVLSPYLRTLPLEAHGLVWRTGAWSVAHPLLDGPTALLQRSVDATAERLGADAATYRRLVAPFLENPHGLLADLMAPLGIPKHPILMARFGLHGLRSAVGLARRFRTPQARALLAGCAGHSILPLERLTSAAVGLVFLLTGHVADWPVAEGGSQAIADALVSLIRSRGGAVRTGVRVSRLDELPTARAVFFDTSPRALLAIAGDALPGRYERRVSRFRYGPGVFKVDWALDGPIPWTDPECARASTVHVGDTLEAVAASEAAMWRGDHHEKPFLLVCQQADLDPTRAPDGKRTGYAYCHVPAGSTVDMTERIEAQIERFAPGFRDRILARASMGPADFEAHNPNYIGGAITGGVADLFQLFTRPVARWSPYTTPNPRLFLCSASTPPGGGVHGMCGFHAANAALKRILR